MYILSHTVYVSNFALFGERQYGVTVETVGYVLAYIGFISIILRGFLLGKIIDRFQEKNITRFGFISNAAGLIMVATFHKIPFLLLAATLFSVGSGLLRPTLMAEISRKAGEDKQGEILGIAGSIGSIAQIIGPITGGFALTYISAPSLPLMAVVFSLTGLYLFTKIKNSNLT